MGINELQRALSYHRHLRDVGNCVLFGLTALGTLIEAVWPQPPELFLVRSEKATKPLLKWYRYLKTARGKIVTAIGLAVLATILFEIKQGYKADLAGDRIQTILQERAIAGDPRYNLIFPPTQVGHVDPDFSLFSQQKTDIRIGTGHWDACVWDEASRTANFLAWFLGLAGWVAPDGSELWRRGDIPADVSLQGIAVEIAPTASPRTQAAAKLLRKKLRRKGISVGRNGAYGPPPPNLNPSTILVIVGSKG